MLTNGCFAVTIQWYLVQRFLDALIECIRTLFFSSTAFYIPLYIPQQSTFCFTAGHRKNFTDGQPVSSKIGYDQPLTIDRWPLTIKT